VSYRRKWCLGVRREFEGSGGLAEKVACREEQPANRDPPPTKKVTQEASAGKWETPASGLDDLIRRGARQIVQQAIEAELATLLERYDNVKTLDGRRNVIRNGYLPEREVVTAVGPVIVKGA
jgi:hypothetical protein